jgi:hypothetical protein
MPLYRTRSENRFTRIEHGSYIGDDSPGLRCTFLLSNELAMTAKVKTIYLDESNVLPKYTNGPSTSYVEDLCSDRIQLHLESNSGNVELSPLVVLPDHCK